MTPRRKRVVKKVSIGALLIVALSGGGYELKGLITEATKFVKQKNHQEAWFNNKIDELQMQIDSLKNKK